ncbi:MAG: hypothetical protein COW85_01205 [Ignavibacteria bacterium CG22_combo_CG10-13_8_21_14_all_37_15]|nr:MAG: hypothetical protein COW85_01205 [Ignavibacteria bacterium CG22_combo_CG10-13_8_21_14_all_37_15]
MNVPSAHIGDGINYLKENEEVEILFNGEEIISVDIPIFINLKVVSVEPGAKGDTVSNVTKPAKLETGATINVPLFINEGELLKIDTRTGSYVERVKG